MSWLALLLLGVAVSDLVFSVRPMRVVPEVAGAAVALLGGIGLCGLHAGRDVVALVVVAVLVLGWGLTVTHGFAADRAWLPLTWGAVGVVAAGLAGGWATTDVGGPFARWLSASPYDVLSALDPDRALLILALLMFQLSTGNVIVRLVLAVTGSRNPSRIVAVDHGQDDVRPLKGGRLLGPMERLLILGLGLAGQVTAASIVIAAKGLLRFPDLQASRELFAREAGEPGIHEVTEYFLVGSFVSWIIALGGVALALA